MYLVKMPRLGITMTAGKVARWLAAEGDRVETGQTLFEMESEKSAVEIESQSDGVLRKIFVVEDEEVAVNTVIAVIAAADEVIDLAAIAASAVEDDGGVSAAGTPAPAAPAVPAASSARPSVSPRVRKLAQELGVKIDEVAYAGSHITEDDVKRHAAAGSRLAERVVDLSATQKAMADNLVQSWTTIPHFTQIVSVDMTRLLAAKASIGVGLNDLLIKLIGDTAVDHPFINGRFERGRLLTAADANVCVAVTTPKGLIVPVIEAVQAKSLAQVSAELSAIASQARNGDTGDLKFSGGSITFSNLGAHGIEMGTPVINAPQSTLVFAGAIIRKPVVRGDDIVIAPIMKLSICFDHRLIEGAVAAAFSVDLKNRIEAYAAD